jgi:hypothetical protein
MLTNNYHVTLLLHVPQLLLSDPRSGQAPLHGAKLLLVHMQAPDLQVLPEGHYI